MDSLPFALLGLINEVSSSLKGRLSCPRLNVDCNVLEEDAGEQEKRELVLVEVEKEVEEGESEELEEEE